MCLCVYVHFKWGIDIKRDMKGRIKDMPRGVPYQLAD